MRSLLAGIFSSAGWRAGAALALAAAVGLTEGLTLVLLVPLLSLAGVEVQGGAESIAARLTGILGAVGITASLVSVLLLYVILTVLQATLVRAKALADTAAVHRYSFALRARLYTAISGAEWLTLARMRSSDFTFALTTAVDQVENGASNLLHMIASTLVVLVYLAFALRLSPQMSAVVVGAGLFLLAIQRARSAVGRSGGKVVTSRTQELYATASEQLGGLKTARSYGHEQRHLGLFIDIARQINDSRMALTRAFAATRWQMTVASVIVLSAILYVAIEVLALPTAAILLLLFLFSRLVPRAVDLQHTWQQVASATPALETIEKLIASCAATPESRSDGASAPPLTTGIELRDVSFSYDSLAAARQLSSVDMIIEAGRTTAIIGPSGAGKSTIADLLLGLMRPTSGEIRIDGLNLGDLDLRSWRALIGYVAQDTFLFNESVRFNLDWAKPGATETEMRDALEQAAALDFVSALPQGLDTLIGERGVRLSGGEKQRLSLARALLRRPRLLVLDEATSALDFENEEKIFRAISELHGEMTIVIITHRIATIRGADRIYTLESGRVKREVAEVGLGRNA